MSIQEALRRLVAENKVAYVSPATRGVRPKRHFLLAADLHSRLQEAMGGSTREDVRLAMLLADIDTFVCGKIVTFGNDPFDKDKNAYMARTSPVQDGIFDLRSQDPRPALRLFGAFCCQDVFLGLSWRYRRDLGGRDQRLFDQAVLHAMGRWDALLPDHKRLYSERVEDHISEYVHVV